MEIVENSVKSKKLYTGIGLFSVIAVNPDSFGIRKIYGWDDSAEVREPNYNMGEDKGHRIDVYLKYNKGMMEEMEKEPIMKVSFFTKDEEVTSKTGKYLFVNHSGVSFYYNSLEEIVSANELADEDYKKYDLTGAHKAKGGEVELLEFIIAVRNINPTASKVYFENYSKIANGNVTELIEILQPAIDKGKVFYAMCGVKDEKYQDVYGKKFLPYGYQSYQMKRFLKDVNYGYKAYFTEDFKEFTPTSAPMNMEQEVGGNKDSDNPLF